MDYYNTYDYMDSAVDSIATGIVAIYLIVLAVWALFYVISYVFKGIGIYTIAKRQGKEYPWLAFIPFARTFLHGELAGDIRLKNKSIKNPGIWLLVMPFIFGAVNFVFYLLLWAVGFGALAGIFSNVMYGYGHYHAEMSIGGIMGLIIILLLWIASAVIYGAVYKVLRTLINHQILERFTTPNMSVAHAVLCFLIPLYESICLFIMRNRPYNPGMEPDLGRPFMQVPPVAVPPQGNPGETMQGTQAVPQQENPGEAMQGTQAAPQQENPGEAMQGTPAAPQQGNPGEVMQSTPAAVPQESHIYDENVNENQDTQQN